MRVVAEVPTIVVPNGVFVSGERGCTSNVTDLVTP
jgi:hypothetical protein